MIFPQPTGRHVLDACMKCGSVDVECPSSAPRPRGRYLCVECLPPAPRVFNTRGRPVHEPRRRRRA